MPVESEYQHVPGWYAAGLEHHAEELSQAARLARLRASRLAGHRGDSLRIFSEAMAAAEKELRKAAAQLRCPSDTCWIQLP